MQVLGRAGAQVLQAWGRGGGLSVQLTLVLPSPAADRKGGSKILEEATDKRKMMEIL